MSCCDAWGNCTRGIGCPAGPATVAKIGKAHPAYLEYVEPCTWRDRLGDLAKAVLLVIAVSILSAAIVIIIH
jgi:hypothetical protein